MVTKQKLIETLKQLPDKFSADEIIERILLLDKIEVGVQQSENGQVTPDDELDQKLPGWLR